MPLYDFKNIETNEIESHMLSLSEYNEFLSSHPELKRVFDAPAFVSGTADVYTKAGDGWKDLMSRVKDGAGKQSTIKTR